MGDDASTSHHSSVEDVMAHMKSDKKINPSVSTKTFLTVTMVGIPTVLGVLLPLAIVNTVGKKIFSGGSKAKPTTSSSESPKDENDDADFPAISELTPQKDRKYDLVLLGSTGFAGKLATEHLVKTYGVNKTVKWAIAGRSKDKLDSVKASLAKDLGSDEVMKVESIIVDTSQRSSLHGLVKDTKTVATSAGPFSLYGSPVVEFCARYGTNYVDITGEVDWHKDMIMKWEDTAIKTGAKIISFCGFDCIPWDMTVYKMAQIMKKECDDDLQNIDCLDEVKGGGASGGTIATMLLGLDGNNDAKTEYDFNPLLRKPDGSKSTHSIKGIPVTKPQRCTIKGLSDKWEAPNVMTMVNTEVVKRSYALMAQGNETLKYREALLTEDFKTACTGFVGLIGFFTALFVTPLRKYIVPKPGEGPSREVMEKGYLCVRGYGKGTRGSEVQTILYFPKEAGYMDTGRMIAESGLCLALDTDALPVKDKGGFYTAATGMGDALLDRLCKTGTKFGYNIVSKL